MNTIGEKIKLLRVKNNLSLKELGSVIGLSDTALSKIENSKTRNITIDTGKELAKAFKVSFNELFEISSSSDSEIVDLKELVDLRKEVIDLRKENETLQSRNELLKQEVDIYRPLLKLLIDKGMVGSPRTDYVNENEPYKLMDETDIIKEINDIEKKRKDIINEIKNKPELLKELMKVNPNGWISEFLKEE